MIQDSAVTATVTEVGDWKYWLQVGSNDRDWLGIPVNADINPVFNFEFLSFIFNQFTEDGSAYSWLLRFKDQPTLERFQEGLLRALWEQLNEMKWTKMKDKERDYVTDAFADLVMEDADQAEEEEEEEEEDVEEEDVEDDRDRSARRYDSDEDADDVETQPRDKETNKQIAVGYKNNRTFVVRGSKDRRLQARAKQPASSSSTNISKVRNVQRRPVLAEEGHAPQRGPQPDPAKEMPIPTCCTGWTWSTARSSTSGKSMTTSRLSRSRLRTSSLR